MMHFRLLTTWREESKDSEDDQNVSKDVADHIRVPGGHNSKGHGWHPVTYAQQSERVYPADKLLARCGETHQPRSSEGSQAREWSQGSGGYERRAIAQADC